MWTWKLKNFSFFFILRKYKRSCKPPVTIHKLPHSSSAPHLLVILSRRRRISVHIDSDSCHLQPTRHQLQVTSHPLVISTAAKRSGEISCQYSSHLSVSKSAPSEYYACESHLIRSGNPYDTLSQSHYQQWAKFCPLSPHNTRWKATPYSGALSMIESVDTGKSAGGTGIWNGQLSPTYPLVLQWRTAWLSWAYWVVLKQLHIP